MREIKFKVWHKEEKCFFSPWSRGWRFEPENGQMYVDGMNVTDRVELMQYTGLKNKNEKEIYEGDIITYPDATVAYTSCGNEYDEIINTGVVEYDNFLAQYYVTNRETVDIWDVWEAPETIEIIGNIHENPELLEVSHEQDK